ncbi:MAG: tetratricopeptide repeat protein [Vicinamibacterales bacterium]
MTITICSCSTSRFEPKVLTEDTIGYERWIESEPDSAPLHNTVASLYLQLNRPQDAVRHFRAAAHLDPDSPASHFNLGTALTVAGDYESAVLEYQRALSLKKDYSQAHNNLGSILLNTGRVAEAVPHLNDAIRLDPTNAQARYNAGIAALRQRNLADAVMHLKKAVQLAPDAPSPMVDLAWLLAAAPQDALRDPGLAIRLAERAVSLTNRRDAGALDVLAAAQAASDDFESCRGYGERRARLEATERRRARRSPRRLSAAADVHAATVRAQGCRRWAIGHRLLHERAALPDPRPRRLPPIASKTSLPTRLVPS